MIRSFDTALTIFGREWVVLRRVTPQLAFSNIAQLCAY